MLSAEVLEQVDGVGLVELVEVGVVPNDQLLGMQSGILAMHDHVSRALGVDICTAEGHLRMAGALGDFYSHPLLDPEFVAKTRAAMEPLRAPNPPIATGTDPGAEGS